MALEFSKDLFSLNAACMRSIWQMVYLLVTNTQKFLFHRFDESLTNINQLTSYFSVILLVGEIAANVHPSTSDEHGITDAGNFFMLYKIDFLKKTQRLIQFYHRRVQNSNTAYLASGS